MEPHRLGMLLFISSEAIFFGSLIITFLVHRNGPGAEGAALLDVLRTALFSVALFASSGTIALAGWRLERGDQSGLRWWLLATVALGAVFLMGQGWEYSHLVAHGFTIGTGIFGSSFYTLTGFHGLHVLAGLVALGILWWVAGSRDFPRRGGGAFEPVSLYWHFVDVVWVGIFVLVYLLPLF